MKYTTEEMLFALEVRKLTAKWQSVYADMSNDSEAFKQQHPLEEYVPLAIKEIERIADAIALARPSS